MRVIAGVHAPVRWLPFGGMKSAPRRTREGKPLQHFEKQSGRAAVSGSVRGDGGIGIEAISRGAAEVVFVDQRRESVALVKKNLALLKEEAEVVLSDAIAYLRRAEPFDVIFIDPPYAGALGEAALRVIAENALLTEDGVAVFEHEEPFAGEIPGLRKTDERKYGRVYLSFFGREGV